MGDHYVIFSSRGDIPVRTLFDSLSHAAQAISSKASHSGIRTTIEIREELVWPSSRIVSRPTPRLLFVLLTNWFPPSALN